MRRPSATRVRGSMRCPAVAGHIRAALTARAVCRLTVASARAALGVAPPGMSLLLLTRVAGLGVLVGAIPILPRLDVTLLEPTG